MTTLTEYTAVLRKATAKKKLEVDLKTHKPTPNELNNMTYLPFKAILGLPPRGADIAMVALMAKDKTVAEGAALIGEFMWDHWMGEPETPTEEEVSDAVLAFAEQLFTLPSKSREDIG